MLTIFRDVLKRNPESGKRFGHGLYYNRMRNVCCAIGASNLQKAHNITNHEYSDPNGYGDPNITEIDQFDLYDYFQLENLGVTKKEAKLIQDWNDNFVSKTQQLYRDKGYITGFDYRTESEFDYKDRFNYVMQRIEEYIVYNKDNEIVSKDYNT